MKKIYQILTIALCLNHHISLAEHQRSKNLGHIASEIAAQTEDAANLGGLIGGVPGAVAGAVPGAMIGFVGSIPMALASTVVVPWVTFFSGNILLAPLSAVVAPAYTLGMGTMGGLYCGAAISGATGFIAGSGMGALLGLTKGTACHLTEIPPAIHKQFFGDPIKRRIARLEDDVHGSMLAMVEKKEFTENEQVTCSVCHEEINEKELSYVFRHCHCEQKALCNDCKGDFLSYHLKGQDFPIECPGGCAFPVTEVDFERLGATREQISKFKANLLKSLVCQQTKLRFCPTEDCLNGKIVEGQKESQWHCEVCHFKGCILCGEAHTDASHQCDMNTAEIKKILVKGKMRREPTDPTKGTIRPCYYCGKIINRIDGCNSVRCSECHKTFHWNKGKAAGHDFDNGEMEYEPLKEAHF